MEGTVTIPLKEYEKLKLIKECLDEKKMFKRVYPYYSADVTYYVVNDQLKEFAEIVEGYAIEIRNLTKKINELEKTQKTKKGWF